MMRVIALSLAIVFACATAAAQDLRLVASEGFGPFTSGVVRTNGFSVQGYPSGAVADSVEWQITSKDGIDGALRVVRSAKTALAPWQTTMAELPFVVQPSINAKAGYTLNGTYVSRQLSAVIRMVPPVITWTSTNNWTGINIGTGVNARYGIRGCPPGTTRIVLYLIPSFGAPLDSVVRNGTNLDSATMRYSTSSHRGALTIQAVITYPGTPTGGFLIARAIPDILPTVNVRASLGMGPFVTGRDAFNTFTIDSTLGAYTSARFTFFVRGRYGALYQVGRQNASWVPASDRFQIVTNMGDLPAYTSLRVEMFNSSGNVSSTQSVPINVVPTHPPLFTMRRMSPLTWNARGLDSIVIDTLPARTMRSHLAILSPTGKLVKDTAEQTGAFGFLRRASIRFDGGTLPLHTHTLRATFWNNYSQAPSQFDYYFDVRDTSQPYIFASTYGPFVQTDSATFTAGVTDLRPPSQPLTKRVGWFQIVDTLTGAVHQRSGVVALDTVRRADSLWWIDSLGSRGLIQTAALPVSAGLEFVDVGMNNTDTVFTHVSTHPMMMIPSQGVLTASAGFGPFTAGRNLLNTFTIDSLPEDVQSVEFAVTGIVNESEIDSLLLTQIVGRRAQFTTNMGSLPVNARLRVTVTTVNGPQEGVTHERFLNTIPDTLALRTGLRYDAMTLDWQTRRLGSLTQITGPRRVTDTLTIRRLPAQTEWISVATYDAQENRIDSTIVEVPYRVRFDSTLVMNIPFSFGSFATTRVEVRVFSTGGLPEGITYSVPVTVARAPFSLTVRRVNPVNNSLDTQPIRQGTADRLDVTTRVVAAGVNAGFAPDVVIDSTRVRFVTCRGAIDDAIVPRLATSNPASSIVSDALYTASPLTLVTTRAEVTVYSKMLTLPASGFVYTDTIRIVPAPVSSAAMRGDFPTYRVNDTTRLALYNPYTIADLSLVDSISNLRIVNNTNNTVMRFSNRLPVNDSVHFVVNVDSSVFTPTGSPYRILADANYSVCSERRTFAFAVDTFTISRQLPGTPDRSHVWSSAGWGPFQQGRSRMSQFSAVLDPSAYMPPRNPRDTTFYHVLHTTLRAVMANRTTVQATYLDRRWSPDSTLPKNVKFLSNEAQIGGLVPGTLMNLTVRRLRVTPTGEEVQTTQNYYFPVEMAPFPAQPLSSSDGWGPFEQSVTAGSRDGMATMARPITVTDTVYSDIVQRIEAVMTNESGTVLGSTVLTPGESNGSGMTFNRLYRMRDYDVAQFPWPGISRDNKNVTLGLRYFFQGNNALGALQNQSIGIDPRAYWLNGSRVSATSVQGDSVFLTVLTPLPTSNFTTTLPMLGTLPFRMGDINGELALSHRVIYNTRTKGFAFQPSDIVANPVTNWHPLLEDIAFNRIRYNSYARDGELAPGPVFNERFRAMRHFEPDDQNRPNRNLRIRSMVNGLLTINLTTMYKVVEACLRIMNIIGPREPTGAVSFAFLWFLQFGSEQQMNVNIGVDASDQMTHIGTVPPLSQARPVHANTYPSATSISYIIDFSLGGEIRLAWGLGGFGLMVNNITRLNYGTTHQGPLSNLNSISYPTGITNRTYLVLDVAMLWGLYRREIFRGQLFNISRGSGTPTFQVFPLAFEAAFQFSHWNQKDADIEKPQADRITREPLPGETPFYYSHPSIDADDSSVVVAWTEHTLRSNSGQVVLGRVNTDSMSFASEAVVTVSDNAVHDPVVRLLRNDGTSLVLWNENRNDASVIGSPADNYESILNLLRDEDLHAAIVNANNEVVATWTLGNDVPNSNGRVDGKATVAVSNDGNTVVVAWPFHNDGTDGTDVMATVLKNDGNRWTTTSTTVLESPFGFDDWLDIMPVRDSSFVLVSRTTSAGDEQKRVSQLQSWRYANDTWSRELVMATEEPGVNIESVSLDGNGDYGMMAVVTSKVTNDTNGHLLALRTYQYTDEWQAPQTLHLDGARGSVRDVELSVGNSGEASLIADVLYPTQLMGNDRRSFAYTLESKDASWQEVVNSDALYEPQERLWNMSSAIGPNNVIYVVDQELDSTYGNIQKYKNGIQVGPARINTVLHALRRENGKLVSVPFTRPTAVDVHEDIIEKNLRYPSTLYAPYPNPTSGDALVPFTVLQRSHVRIDVVDVTGNIMETLVDSDLDPGIYDATIPLTSWPQGCYTVRMLTGTGQLMSKPFTVVR